MALSRLIPENIGKAFSAEFSELLPQHVIIPQENDLLSFQFTSEWAEVVARYIIGIAAAISGDFQNAEILYSEALERLGARDHNFAIYLKLKERIPIRVSELYESWAVRAYLAWASSHEPSHMDQLGLYLAKIAKVRQEEPRILSLRAIYTFVHDESVETAIEILKRREHGDGLWHSSLHLRATSKPRCDIIGRLFYFR